MTQKSTRLRDPVHFFNHEGTPILTIQHLMEQNAKLEADNARLLRLLKAQVAHNRAGDPLDTSSKS